MEEAAWICVAEYCPPYLAFGRDEWALNYSMCEQSVNCVIFLYQHRVSIKRRRRCESAADLVHFSSSAIEATVPQCSTLHPIVTSKRVWKRGLLQATSPRTPAFMRVNRSVSTTTETCITQLPHTHTCKTMLSVCAQAAQAREYINHGRHGDLDGKCLFWLHILDRAKIGYRVLTGARIGLMNHATWYCLIECTKSKLDSH